MSNNEHLEAALQTISQLYSYRRYSVNKNSGKINIFEAELSYDKDKDKKNIEITGKINNITRKTKPIKLEDFVDIIDRARSVGLSFNNEDSLETYMNHFLRDIFNESCNNEEITLRNMLSNSIMLFYRENKPFLVVGRDMYASPYFLEFSDFVPSADEENELGDKDNIYVVLTFDYLEKSDKSFSLYEDIDSINKEKDLTIVLMNNDCRDRLFRITLRKSVEATNCYILDSIQVLKRNPFIKIMNENYDNLQKILIDCVNVSNKKSTDLTSLID